MNEIILQNKEEGVAYWAAFYRKNPQRFVAEYLNVKLKLFQKILIYMMMVSTNEQYISYTPLLTDKSQVWLTKKLNEFLNK